MNKPIDIPYIKLNTNKIPIGPASEGLELLIYIISMSMNTMLSGNINFFIMPSNNILKLKSL